MAAIRNHQRPGHHLCYEKGESLGLYEQGHKTKMVDEKVKNASKGGERKWNLEILQAGINNKSLKENYELWIMNYELCK